MREVAPRTVVVAGFLGAGRTTLLRALARRCGAGGTRVAAAVGDVGTLVLDAGVVAGLVPATPYAAGGLVDAVAAARDADVVLVELPGTEARPRDAAAGAPAARVVTVVPVAWLAAAASPVWADALIDRQAGDADVVAVSHVDAVPPEVLAGAVAAARARWPGRRVVPVSARTGRGVGRLLAALRVSRAADGALAAPDADVRGVLAQIACLDTTVSLARGGWRAAALVDDLVARLEAAVADAGATSLRVKLLLDDGRRLACRGMAAPVRRAPDPPAASLHASVRVRGAMPALASAWGRALEAWTAAHDVAVHGGDGRVFLPPGSG